MIGLRLGLSRGTAGEILGPVNTVAPAITGSGKIGSEHTVSNGTWTGTGTITYARQWLRNGSPISGATTAAYTPVAGDDETNLSCRVTPSDDLGSRSSTSAAVAITYVAPAASGTIDAQTVGQDSVATYDASANFTGGGLTYSITAGGAVASIDASTGLITFTTGAAVTASPFTVQAANSGGTATQASTLTVVPVSAISSPAFDAGSLSFNLTGAATIYAIFSDDVVDSLIGSQIKAAQQAGVTGTTYAVATGAVTAGSNSINIDTASVPAGLRVLHIATETLGGFDTASFEVIFEEAAAETGIGAWIIGTDFTVAPPEGSIGNATVGSNLTVAA